MIKLAAGTLLGEKVTNLCKQTGLLDENSFYTVKAPVFSTIKLPGVDPKLVPDMKSTGEVIALDATLEGGMTKAFIWNETLAEGFAKEKKEMYMQSFDPHFVHVSERCEKAGIHVISETESHLEDWFKSPEALAVYSTETDSTARKRALECQLLVMSAEETVRAFSMITDENFSVQDILQFQLKNKKEVILK